MIISIALLTVVELLRRRSERLRGMSPTDQAIMKTALITHADCLDHVTPAGHPEQVARLEHVLHALAPLDLDRITALISG